MTLQITQVHDAAYQSNGTVLFRCDCGDITDVYCQILDGPRNVSNNKILQRWLANNTPDEYIEPVIPEISQEELEYNAKVAERSELKAMTAIELLALTDEERRTKIARFNELKTL